MATQQGAQRYYERTGYRTTTTTTTTTTARRRRKKKRRNRTMLFSMAVLGLLGTAVLAYQFFFNKAASMVEMNPTPISTASTYLNTGDGILYQTDGQIHFYHLTDSKKNYTYGMGASDIRMSGSESMTVVFNTASLQVVGQKDTIGFTGTVKEVECGDQYLAVLRANEAGVDTLWLLTPAGEMSEITEVNGQCIVDFGFYTVGGEKLWIETLNVNSGTPMTTITSYDIGKKSVTGVMNIYNQLVDSMYITSSSIFVAGTNQIIRYTHDGNKEVYRTMIYGYHPVDFSNASGSSTFLMTPRGGDFHSVKILTLAEGSDANVVETYLQLPTEGVDAYIMGSSLVVASREQMYTYSLKGKLQKTATFEQPIDSAVKLNDTMLLLSSNGTYYIAKV